MEITKDVAEEIVSRSQRGIIDDCEQDYQGQLVIYTGVFVWSDGTYHTEAEKEDTTLYTRETIV